MSESTSAAVSPPLASIEPGKNLRPVVALIGNPNCGKTTLFNRLTGSTARVGNYPGITVDHREGLLSLTDERVARVVDLPGTYSLVPRAEDEVVALHGLLGRLPGLARPSLVLAVVDATNLERNLYLVAQLREFGAPLVVVLTMMDTVETDGLSIHVRLLQERLGVPVVPVSAATGQGVETLKKVVEGELHSPTLVPALPSPTSTSEEVEAIGRDVSEEFALETSPSSLGLWALSVREGGAFEHVRLSTKLSDALSKLPNAGAQIEHLIAARYARVHEWMQGVISRRVPEGPTRSEMLTKRIDAVALHRVLGPLSMILIFGGLFQALFTWSTPVMDAIQDAMAWCGGRVGDLVPESLPFLKSLLVDGVIAGVGNVVVFVPQIAVLFFFLGVLEDSGYLARAAFILDRLMARVGLHGRAFVPMLSGFACAVPAIMAARTIESRKDRLVTMLVTPLISCSARLPVYGLMIATVFATRPPIFGVFHPGAVVMIAMYLLSVGAAIGMAFIFKRTILKSPPPPFVLELPPYRRPRMSELLRHVGRKVKSFLTEAGTVILAITIVLWGLFNFPRSSEAEVRHEVERARIEASVTDTAEREAQLASLHGDAARARLEYSLGGRMGHAIEPVIKPLGWDWKVGVGIIASFAAREVLVATLGLVYGLGEGAEEDNQTLQESMRKDRDPVTGQPIHTPLSGLSLMVFFVLAMQCMSTLAAVRRESGSWRWPAFQFAYMTVLAYVAALLVFQGGRLLGWG
jgi:ferrous iron transport protein B